MHCFAQLPAHYVQAAQQHKERDGGREHVTMVQGVDEAVGNIEEDAGRVHQHIPAVPAQSPAQINRKTAQKDDDADEHTGSAQRKPSAQFVVHHVQAAKTKQRGSKNTRGEHNDVEEQAVALDFLQVDEVANHIKTVGQQD